MCYLYCRHSRSSDLCTGTQELFAGADLGNYAWIVTVSFPVTVDRDDILSLTVRGVVMTIAVRGIVPGRDVAGANIASRHDQDHHAGR